MVAKVTIIIFSLNCGETATAVQFKFTFPYLCSTPYCTHRYHPIKQVDIEVKEQSSQHSDYRREMGKQYLLEFGMPRK